MQELKGAIRVYCRIRPMIAKEVKDNETKTLSKRDEFSVELLREGRKEDKQYNFDGIFDESNSQMDVFRDCKDLIQSAIDGFNVFL